MDKRRTIYKLVDLRGCIFLAIINVIFGTFLLAGLKSFPHIISFRIQEGLLATLEGDLSEKMSVLHNLADKSMFYFINSATNTIMFSAISMISVLLLIRLNGELIYRKIVSWMLILGVTIINIASFYYSVRFMNSGSSLIANEGVGFLNSIGYILFIGGLIVLFLKTLKDLSQPRVIT